MHKRIVMLNMSMIPEDFSVFQLKILNLMTIEKLSASSKFTKSSQVAELFKIIGDSHRSSHRTLSIRAIGINSICGCN